MACDCENKKKEIVRSESKKKNEKGRNKDIKLTFHQFDFFSCCLLLYSVETNKILLLSTSLAQSALAGSCRKIFFISYRFI